MGGGKLTAQGLIDTTEMYLRTIYELEEEGIPPLRARIAERLAQTGPTVSQTVARMERDGLLHVAGDRHLSLSSNGRTLATRVMRKHRLAECLLVSVIQLPWEEVHIEACRWEHVISESVERRLYQLLDHPVRCPHGNIIPGLAELDAAALDDDGLPTDQMMVDIAGPVLVTRISEQVQSDLALMLKLRRAGIQPGRRVVVGTTDGGVQVTSGTGDDAVSTDFPQQVASHVFVTKE
jgi:DtxR family transcriptional regulator, Mn-dependent transcriptional regulator